MVHMPTDSKKSTTNQELPISEIQVEALQRASVTGLKGAADVKPRKSWNVKIPLKTDDQRDWLPGQPPPRLSAQHHQMLLRMPLKLTAPLAPLTEISLKGDLGNACIQRYLGQAISLPNCLPDEIYLFHATALGPSAAHIVNSFRDFGPSLRFARARGYLSPTPAVYYTTSIELALLWIIFTTGGKWDVEGGFASHKLSGLIYVAKVNIKRLLKDSAGVAFLNPQTEADEGALQTWCEINEHSKPFDPDITKRLTGHDTWKNYPLLFSRIPWSTLVSLEAEGQCTSTLRSHIDPLSIWLLAASDQAVAESIAKQGQEVIVINNLKFQSRL